MHKTRSNNPLPNPISCKCIKPSLEKGSLVPRPSQSSFCSIRFCILQAILTERPGNDAQKDRHITNVPVLHTTNDTRLVMCVGKQDAICRSILTIRRILLPLRVWRSRVTTAYNSAMHNHQKCRIIQTRPLLPLFISLGPWMSSWYRTAGNFRWYKFSLVQIFV